MQRHAKVLRLLCSIVVVGLLALSLSGCWSLPGGGTTGSSGSGRTWTKSQLQNLYIGYLRENNLDPSLNGDGDVVFHYNSGNYVIAIDEDDPGFFRVIYPNFWTIDSDLERSQVAAAASYTSRTIKAAKVYITGSDNSNTSIEVAMFLRSPEDFEFFLDRVLSCLGSARSRFIEQMNK
jgi:hypothetical protein